MVHRRVQAAGPRGLALQGQLVLLLMLVTVPTLTALGWVAIARNHQALTVDAQHYHRLLAERAASSVEASLESQERTLLEMAEVLSSAQVASDEARLTLASALLKKSDLADVWLYSEAGERRGGIHVGPTEREPAPMLPENFRKSSVTRGPLVLTPQGPFLPVSIPAPSHAESRFYLYAELPLSPLCELVKTLGEAPPLRDTDGVFVIDATGQRILAADLKTVGLQDVSGILEALRGRPSFQQSFSIAVEFLREKQPMLGAVSSLSSRGWAVVVQESRDHAYMTLESLRFAVFVAVGSSILIALAVGTLGARRVIRPLALLVDAARRIARREWSSVASEVSSRSDEVGALAKEVDLMSEGLRTSEANLIKEVEVRSALARYLSSDVVDQVVKDPSRLKLGGERRAVTVLFADVVGFTRLAEQLAPETTVTVLNEYFTFASEIIHRHGGMIDKFIGDCVMAVWGLPESRTDDAQRALDAAEAIRRWIDAGNRRWKQKYGIELQIAMGLHTGMAVAGNVGSQRRMDYTVIGDTVNVAARLEASAAPGQILVSDAIRHAVGDKGQLEPLGERNLRGRTQTTAVYEVR